MIWRNNGGTLHDDGHIFKICRRGIYGRGVGPGATNRTAIEF